MIAALDGRLDLNVRWRGGELDRLVDSRHAPVVSAASDLVASSAWQVLQEVTYAISENADRSTYLGCARRKRSH